MVNDCIGISPLPKKMIESELFSGKLEVINASWIPRDLHFTASYSKSPYNGLIDKAIEIAVLAAK